MTNTSKQRLRWCGRVAVETAAAVVVAIVMAWALVGYLTGGARWDALCAKEPTNKYCPARNEEEK